MESKNRKPVRLAVVYKPLEKGMRKIIPDAL